MFTVEVQTDLGVFWRPAYQPVTVDAASASIAAQTVLGQGQADHVVLGRPWRVMVWEHDANPRTGHLWWKSGPNAGSPPCAVVDSDLVGYQTDHGMVDTRACPMAALAEGDRLVGGNHARTLYEVVKPCGEHDPLYPNLGTDRWLYVRDLAFPELPPEEVQRLNGTEPGGAPGYGFFSYGPETSMARVVESVPPATGQGPRIGLIPLGSDLTQPAFAHPASPQRGVDAVAASVDAPLRPVHSHETGPAQSRR
jgi:hypothetical protein